MALTRRDFNRLTAAAFGGALAGASIGCGGDDAADNGGAPAGGNSPGDSTPDKSAGDNSPPQGETKLVGGELPEKNACLGLNQCKEYGKNPGEHDCAGHGACATVSHECKEKNSCKFLGACIPKVGANDCRGKGGCQVPMTPGEELWQQARAAFEERMKTKGVEVGEAPLP